MPSHSWGCAQSAVKRKKCTHHSVPRPIHYGLKSGKFRFFKPFLGNALWVKSGNLTTFLHLVFCGFDLFLSKFGIRLKAHFEQILIYCASARVHMTQQGVKKESVAFPNPLFRLSRLDAYCTLLMPIVRHLFRFLKQPFESCSKNCTKY